MRCGIACRRLGSTTTRPSEANHRVIGSSEYRKLSTEHRSLEPAAAVSQPPGDVSDRDGRPQRPPDRQNEIGGEPEHGEREPEDLALHTLDCRSFALYMTSVGSRRKNFGLGRISNQPLAFSNRLIRGHWVWLNADC